MHPRTVVKRVPPYVSFILRYQTSEISKKRHYQCGTRVTTADCTPRVHTQASDGRTGIGGWFPARDREGRLSPWLSSWFSLEITREDFPWIFEKGNRPSLVISTLEASAMLIALKLKIGQDPDPEDTRVMIAPSITDNRGNGPALNKLMSTRFSILGGTYGVSIESQGNELLWSGRHVSVTEKRTFWPTVLQIYSTRSVVCKSVRRR